VHHQQLTPHLLPLLLLVLLVVLLLLVQGRGWVCLVS
jgi:hypothetical protein